MATEPKPDERPLRADARRNRERILEAARYACAEHGASVQIDDVARGAGVGVGTVYRHFPTKDLLIEALVAEKFRITTENIRQALEIEDPWEAFAESLRRNAEVMAADAGLRDALVRIGPDVVHAGEARSRARRARGPARRPRAGSGRAARRRDGAGRRGADGRAVRVDGAPRARLAAAPRAAARRAADAALSRADRRAA